MKQLGPNFVEI